MAKHSGSGEAYDDSKTQRPDRRAQRRGTRRQVRRALRDWDADSDDDWDCVQGLETRTRNSDSET